MNRSYYILSSTPDSNYPIASLSSETLQDQTSLLPYSILVHGPPFAKLIRSTSISEDVKEWLVISDPAEFGRLAAFIDSDSDDAPGLSESATMSRNDSTMSVGTSGGDHDVDVDGGASRSLTKSIRLFFDYVNFSIKEAKEVEMRPL
jgi:hypothetical protein